MDWETLRLIANKGMLLGAHTLNHVHLPRLSPGDAEREIAGSGRLIEERTGRQTLMFAYPYGDATPALQALAGRYYRAGFGTRLAFCTPTSRALQLERIDMFYLQGKPAALAESRRWLASYLALRQVLRQVRGGLVSLTNDRPFGDRAVVR